MDLFDLFDPPPPIATNPEEAFLQAQKALNDHRESLQSLEEEYQKENAARFARHLPAKRKKKLTTAEIADILPKEVFEACIAEAKQRASDIMDVYMKREEELKAALQMAAEAVTVVPGTEWNQAHYISPHHTQTSVDTYTRVSALLKTFPYQACGLEVEVRPGDRTYRDGGSSCPYTVWVKATPMMIDVARLQDKGPSFVEVIQFCWKNGANPRVYFPTLPHDFESKHGITYY